MILAQYENNFVNNMFEKSWKNNLRCIFKKLLVTQIQVITTVQRKTFYKCIHFSEYRSFLLMLLSIKNKAIHIRLQNFDY